jgi:cytochrome c
MKPRDHGAALRCSPWLLALLLSASGPAFASQALASKHGCLGCHAAATKLVGPAYRDVAAKYGGDAGAPAALVQGIRNGGTGKWGEMVMPPQPQVSEADAKRLAAWILGGAK